MKILSVLIFVFPLLSQGQNQFTDLQTLNGLKESTVIFGDIDGDGDLDAFICGWTGGLPASNFYKNDGDGFFTLMTSQAVEDIFQGSADFGDVDADGDLDLILSGYLNGPNEFTSLYLNDGAGNFSESLPNNFNEVNRSAVKFADFDGDNDLDILITGDYGPQPLLNIWENDGTGNFSLEPYNISLYGVQYSFVAAGDVDGDDDLDFIAGGLTDNYGRLVRLYMNDGNGNFTFNSLNNFPDLDNGSADFGDLDNDGDLDLIITGATISNIPTTKLYSNDGSGTFTEITSNNLTNIQDGVAKFEDIDCDGDQDILLAGSEYLNPTFAAEYYVNDGAGNFIFEFCYNLDFVRFCDIDFGDIDNDGDQDLLVSGESENGDLTKIYENNCDFTELKEELSSYTVFPNPSRGDIIIESKNINPQSLLQLKSLDGKSIPFEFELQNEKLIIMKGLKPGSYVLKINNNDVIISLKIKVI